VDGTRRGGRGAVCHPVSPRQGYITASSVVSPDATSHPELDPAPRRSARNDSPRTTDRLLSVTSRKGLREPYDQIIHPASRGYDDD
jgi:hypothetical protein